MKLLTQQMIIDGRKQIMPKEGNSIIYFLIDDDEIVYVGQTKKQLHLRLAYHKNNGRVFDRSEITEVESKYADVVESCYIHTLRPKYNGNSINLSNGKNDREKHAPVTISQMCEFMCKKIDEDSEE